MFLRATVFNQDIGDWKVDSVISRDNMFVGAKKSDHNLNDWNMSNVVNIKDMTKSVTLSTTNYYVMLNGRNDLPLKTTLNFMVAKAPIVQLFSKLLHFLPRKLKLR